MPRARTRLLVFGSASHYNRAAETVSFDGQLDVVLTPSTSIAQTVNPINLNLKQRDPPSFGVLRIRVVFVFFPSYLWSPEIHDAFDGFDLAQ